MRILFAGDSIQPPLTGVGRASLTLLRELAALGHEIVGLDWRDNAAVAEIAGRCEVLAPRRGPMRTARWHLDLLRRVERLGVAHDVLLDPSGYPTAFGRHPALAVTVHDLSALEPGYYRPGKQLFFRTFLGRGLRRARLCVCVSGWTRRCLLARYPDLDPASVRVIPNALEPALADGPLEPPPVEPPYFLFVGTIERRKNVLGVLDAFATARAGGVDARLVLAGRTGHGGAEARRRAQAPDLRDHVVVVERPPDAVLRALYAHALALVLCSLDEGFGLPILEAMQAGIPVVTSNVTAMPEVAGDAALIVDPRDGGAIASALAQLWRDGALRDDLVRRGRARVAEFTPRRIAEQWSEALEELS